MSATMSSPHRARPGIKQLPGFLRRRYGEPRGREGANRRGLCRCRLNPLGTSDLRDASLVFGRRQRQPLDLTLQRLLQAGAEQGVDEQLFHSVDLGDADRFAGPSARQSAPRRPGARKHPPSFSPRRPTAFVEMARGDEPLAAIVAPARTALPGTAASSACRSRRRRARRRSIRSSVSTPTLPPRVYRRRHSATVKTSAVTLSPVLLR